MSIEPKSNIPYQYLKTSNLHNEKISLSKNKSPKKKKSKKNINQEISKTNVEDEYINISYKNNSKIQNSYFQNNITNNKKIENEYNNFDINMNELSMINLIEGLLEKNYLKSEFFFSKVVFLILLEYGDPRGRFNDSHGFMQFALWKISRKTCLLEKNIIINEYLKEMFHSLDYFQKIFWNNYNNDNFIINKIERNI